MNARQHLEQLCKLFGAGSWATDAQAKAVHDARNFLSVPEGTKPYLGESMDPTAYQRRLCMKLVECASALGHDVTKSKGRKLLNFYIENLRGACVALEMLGTDDKRHEQLNGLLMVMMLVCTRGSEVVHALAEGKPIP
jgi:hypothetical protein